MYSAPLVSIIIPTYNRAGLLMEAIQSVLDQTYKRWECIIVDDGSDDETEQFVNKLIQSDSRFKFFKRPQKLIKGVSSCRNYGFFKSSGKYVQWLDDDDLLSKQKISNQVKVLEETNLRAIALCDWVIYSHGKESLRNSIFDFSQSFEAKQLFVRLRKNLKFLPIHSLLTPSSMIERAGLWNIKLSLNDDIEFFGRLIAEADQFLNVTNCYILYREHNFSRITTSSNAKANLLAKIYSYQLLQASLNFNNIAHYSYFKWRLLKIFLHYNKIEKDIIQRNSLLFKQYGIFVELKYYYKIKHNLYIKVFPLIKKIKKVE